MGLLKEVDKIVTAGRLKYISLQSINDSKETLTETNNRKSMVKTKIKYLLIGPLSLSKVKKISKVQDIGQIIVIFMSLITSMITGNARYFTIFLIGMALFCFRKAIDDKSIERLNYTIKRVEGFKCKQILKYWEGIENFAFYHSMWLIEQIYTTNNPLYMNLSEYFHKAKNGTGNYLKQEERRTARMRWWCEYGV